MTVFMLTKLGGFDTLWLSSNSRSYRGLNVHDLTPLQVFYVG